jgi:hypothetical protein
MATTKFELTILASTRNGEPVPREAFPGLLELDLPAGSEAQPSTRKWQTAGIVCVTECLETYGSEIEPNEALHQAIQAGFEEAADWMESIDSSIPES